MSESSSGPSTNSGAWPEEKLVRTAIIVLAGLALFRLWFITHLQLIPDEAYYWLWSKNLALSYRDKGPLVAWAIALGTKVFGDTPFGIRIFAVLMGAGTGWLVFALARRLFDTRTALWSLVLVMTVPLFAAEWVLMTIDPLSIFFWAAAMNLFWLALDSGKIFHWAAIGVLIGLGFLAKFTNGVQLGCIALFLLWSRPHRRFFFSPQSVMMGLAFAVTILPLIVWNMQMGWIHAGALHSRSGVNSSFQIHPAEFFRFVGGECLVLSPLLALGLMIATTGLLWRRHQDPRIRFLLCQFVPLMGIFLFFSLNKAGKENWPAPAYVAGLILLVVFWRELVARAPRWRWAVWPALGMVAVMFAFGHNTDLLRLPARQDPLRSAKGWDDFAAHIQRARDTHHPDILIGHHYQDASMMAYYLSDHPRTYLPKERYGRSQFSLWPGYELTTNTTAIYVTTALNPHPPAPAVLLDFPKSELIDDFEAQYHGRSMTRFQIYICRRE